MSVLYCTTENFIVYTMILSGDNITFYRAAVLTGRHQIRVGLYPEGVDPSDLGGIIGT